MIELECFNKEIHADCSRQRRSLIRPCGFDPTLPGRGSSRFTALVSRFVPGCRLRFSAAPNNDNPQSFDHKQTDMQAYFALRPLPYVLRLSQRPTSVTVPFGEFARRRATDSSVQASSELIIDLSDVHVMDTEFSKLIARYLHDPLVRILPPRTECIRADLTRVGAQFPVRAQCTRTLADNEGQAELESASPDLSLLENEICRLRFDVSGKSSFLRSCTCTYADLIEDLACHGLVTLHPSITASLLHILPLSDLPPFERMKRAGLHVRRADEGQELACGTYFREFTRARAVFFVLQGLAISRTVHVNCTASPLYRASIRSIAHSHGSKLASVVGLKPASRVEDAADDTSKQMERLLPGAVYGLEDRSSSCVFAADGPCWIIEIDPRNRTGIAWARSMAALTICIGKSRDRSCADSPCSDWDMQEKLYKGIGGGVAGQCR